MATRFSNITSGLTQAFTKRQLLTKVTNAFRLVNGLGDGLNGLIIDRYHTVGVIYVYDPVWIKQLDVMVKVLREAWPIDTIVLKDRSQNASASADDIKNQVIIGKQTAVEVNECGLKFHIEANDGLNAGLFLDMRVNRHVVGQMCRGKRVLNCFAYTCSFGVHARAHGALEVMNIDLSKNYLKVGASNYALNNLPVGRGEFLHFDASEFLVKAVKKENLFDVIVIDPPSFARNKGKTFQVKRDLPKMMALGIAALAKSGSLLVSTNCSDLSYSDLERMLAKGLNGKKVKNLRRISQDIDFPATNTFKESYLVGLLIQV